MNEVRGGQYKNLTESQLVKLGSNKILEARKILNTFTFPSGSGIYTFPEPINYLTGLMFTTAETIDYTIIYD